MTAIPQDHKSKTYTFEAAGVTHTIPAFTSLPMGAIRKVRKITDEADQVFTLLEATLGMESEALAAVDAMDAEAFEVFLKGWTQGAPVGESSGS